MRSGFGGKLRPVVATGLLASVIAVAAAPVAHAEWLGPETTIGSAQATQQWPELSGNRLVYSEETANGFEIRVRDLKSGADRTVSDQHSASGRAAVSGWRAIWSDADAQLWLTDLRSGKHRRLSSGPVDEPAISGNWACYTYLGQIRLIKLSTGAESTISAAGSDAAHCDISGRDVVWQQRGEAPGIVGYDRLSGTTTRISEAAAAQNPRVDRGLVVWQSGAASEEATQILLHDLAKERQQVLTEQVGAANPEISDGQVVWQDSRLGHGNSEVYFFDVATGVESRVTQTDGWSGHPSVDAGKVAYQDARGDSHRVYLREIVPPSVSATLSTQADGSQLLSGEVAGSTGVPLVSAKLALEYQVGDGWESGESLRTAGDGSYSVTLPAGTTKARIRFEGSRDYAPATSPEISVQS